MHLVALMTVQHARYTEAVWLNYLAQCQLSLSLCLAIFEKLRWLVSFLLQHFLVTGLTGEDWLVDIAIWVATLLLDILCKHKVRGLTLLWL